MPWSSGDSLNSTNLNYKSGSAYDVRAYGAVGDGTTDDSTAFQNTINAAADGNAVFIPSAATLSVTTTIKLPQGTTLYSHGGTNTGSAAILWSGATGGTVFSPTTTAQSNENIRLIGLEIDGNRKANIGVDLYHVSHGLVQDCYIHGFGSGASSCGVRIYRDRNAGYATYYNRIVGGKISDCTYGVLITGKGSSSSAICANSNRMEYVDFLSNDTTLWFERGNDVLVFACASELPRKGHFQTGGDSLHLSYSRIENSTDSGTLPGLTIDEGAARTVEIGNYWATFTNDPVVDNSLQTDLVRVNMFGTGVLSGANALIAAYRLSAVEIYGRTYAGVLDLHGGGPTSDGSGRVRINRSKPASGENVLELHNGTAAVQASFTSIGHSRMTAGTTILPAYAFGSEKSLGLYRSAASTMALSYGNLALPNAASFASQTGSLPSATSAQGYLYTDSTSSLYWVNGSGVSTLVV